VLRLDTFCGLTTLHLIGPNYEASWNATVTERSFQHKLTLFVLVLLALAIKSFALPTSSGKTFLAQLRVAAELTRAPGSRAVYVAPYRLLASQVEHELRDGLRRIGKTVRDLGSGFDPSIDDQRDDGLPDVAVCTPEKLDALIRLASTDRRGSAEMRQFFEGCQLLIFDELHLLSRPGRGTRFELMLTRIKRTYPKWSILGLCAATHGVEQLAEWLTSSPPIKRGSRPTGTIELAWQTDGRIAQRVANVRGIVGQLGRTGRALDDASTLVLSLDEEYRPVLVITTSRPNAEGMATRLTVNDPAQGSRWRESLHEDQLREVEQVIEEIRALLGHDHKLAVQLSQGVAYHHAGVPSHVLRLIERLASKRVLRALCATTTVAEGSDLPFRVVVIPMLNFESGGSRRLERDLYLNIVGRAGRANVAMEGLVFILESASKTLHDLVPRSLWASTQADRVTSRLPEVSAFPVDLAQWEQYTEIQSQVLSWLSEDAYFDDQATVLAAQTFAGSQSLSERERVTALFSASLASLERDGLALAGSPYRLTRLGELARIGGLCATSTRRLRDALEIQGDSWISELLGASIMLAEQAELLASLVFESIEVLRESLWLRWESSSEPGRWTIVRDIAAGRRGWPSRDSWLSTDISLLAGWISGRSYAELSNFAPIVDRTNSLFGGTDPSKRTSDVAEYLGRIAYPAAWTWSAARMILGSLGEELPVFVRQAVELGAPTASACYLIREVGLARPAAILVSDRAGPKVSDVTQWVGAADRHALIELGLTAADTGRLDELSALSRT
jgi:superfamily II DNA/RNA helicase